MNFKRRLFAFLGISQDARVSLSTDDVDVTILGKPDQVQAVLKAVRLALEEILLQQQTPLIDDQQSLGVNTESLIVLPTELDEKDSPYAIPEHRTVERLDPAAGTDSDYDLEDTGPDSRFSDAESSDESITNPGK